MALFESRPPCFPCCTDCTPARATAEAEMVEILPNFEAEPLQFIGVCRHLLLPFAAMGTVRAGVCVRDTPKLWFPLSSQLQSAHPPHRTRAVVPPPTSCYVLRTFHGLANPAAHPTQLHLVSPVSPVSGGDECCGSSLNLACVPSSIGASLTFLLC